jgi:ribosomal protein S7
MHLLTPFLAIELERERRVTAARRSLAQRASEPADAPRRTVRRRLAVALAAVSRGSASAVRRLDACLADELAGSLASSR